MALDLSRVKNMVIVMMENRSFDHMLGYLNLPQFKNDRVVVEGVSNDPAWLGKYTNFDNGQPFAPFLNNNPYDLPPKFDPPHERPDMARNLGDLQNGSYPMNGFVSGIPQTVSTDSEVRKLVMGYFGAEQVPMSHFFSQQFAICDQWFAPLPAGTQPNRLMSMGGYSQIDVNHDLLPEQDLVYDWLDRRGVNWRVYHQGIPFFTMMPKWIPEILLSDRFRSFAALERDLLDTPPNQLPQVIFVEPTYQDAPHLGFATDEHAPSGVSNGQEFLMQVYSYVTNSPAFWAGTVMIVDYDENGGFFDHVSPPLVPTASQPGAQWVDNTASFVSLGVRTPAYVISPFVQPGSVSHARFDHTSVLKFLGEKFGVNGSYSDIVDPRPVASLSVVLDVKRLQNFAIPIPPPPSAPALDTYLSGRPPAPSGATVPAPDTNLQRGFQAAVNNLRAKGADASHPKFGPLLAAMDNPPGTPGATV